MMILNESLMREMMCNVDFVFQGMASLRVDGNDVFAVFNAVKRAREHAIEKQVRHKNKPRD
jgi:TPP-dependent pyruvate/acetoin dehydrogenase alpha subunit